MSNPCLSGRGQALKKGRRVPKLRFHRGTLTLAAAPNPSAIIDIGSNSVRLVVYAGPPRIPTPIFNEKVLAGLGAGLDRTGRAAGGGARQALAALQPLPAADRPYGGQADAGRRHRRGPRRRGRRRIRARGRADRLRLRSSERGGGGRARRRRRAVRHPRGRRNRRRPRRRQPRAGRGRRRARPARISLPLGVLRARPKPERRARGAQGCSSARSRIRR